MDSFYYSLFLLDPQHSTLIKELLIYLNVSKAEKRTERVRSLVLGHKLTASSSELELLTDVKIENCIGFIRVPLGLAGLLQLKGPDAVGLFSWIRFALLFQPVSRHLLLASQGVARPSISPAA